MTEQNGNTVYPDRVDITQLTNTGRDGGNKVGSRVTTEG